MDGGAPDARTSEAVTADEPSNAENGNEGNESESRNAAAPGLFSRLFGLLGRGDRPDDLADALENGRDDAVRRLPRARREMIERVIAFDEKRVDDVMAPRADITAVDVEIPLDELVRAFSVAGHSRMPIFRGDLDDPLGMVHIKDVVGLLASAEPSRRDAPAIHRIKREVLYVPPSMRIIDLLLRMQASRIHMALVIDEYGGTDGLVTIEDLVEEIVGDINDEHDEEEAPTVTPRPGGGWDADARVELADFSDAAGVEIVADDEEVETLGGLVFSLAGRVPQRGEVLSHPSGFDFEIMEADARKVRKIRVRRRPGAIKDFPSDAEI